MIAAFTQAIDLEPDNVWHQINFGGTLVNLHRPEEALRYLQRATELKPDNFRAQHHLAAALIGLDRFPEAIAILRRTIDLKPEYADAHSALGIALVRSGRPARAVPTLYRAVDLAPTSAEAHHWLGVALADTRRPAEALVAFRRVVELKPNDAEGHMNVGIVLKIRGRFAESLAALERGHELGSRRKDWQFPSARLVREAEKLVAVESKLPLILSDEVQPADAAERIALAQFCQNHKSQYVAAARFFADAFAAEPALAGGLQAGHRYNAACAAALAADDRGKDACKLDDAERSRLRRQALDWLTADLAACAKFADRPDARARLRQTLEHWQKDLDLAGVRDAEALAKLAEVERVDWQKLWDQVAALLKRTDAPPATEVPRPKP